MIRNYSSSVMKEAEKLASKDVAQFAATMADNARQTPPTPRQTGNLADNIAYQVNKLVALVHSQTGKKDGGEGYGFFVHEGTSRVPGRPYLKWAFEKTKKVW